LRANDADEGAALADVLSAAAIGRPSSTSAAETAQSVRPAI